MAAIMAKARNKRQAPKTKSVKGKWRARPNDAGTRLTSYLRRKIGEGASLAAVKRGLEKGLCTINGRIETFGSYKICSGDKVSYKGALYAEPSTTVRIESKAILYEDESLLIYDKPSGIPTEHTRDSARPSMYTALMSYLTQMEGGMVHLVHRLDRDTSGVLLLAKDSDTAEALGELFRERAIHKEYSAIVDGLPKRDEGAISGQLRKKPDGAPGEWESVTEGGKEAVTEWQVKERLERAALLRLYPQTGRTHQLRIHMRDMKHPILGDVLYAKKFFSPYRPKRHLLHASRISFVHPATGEEIDIAAQYPPDFKKALSKLKKK